MSEQRQLKTKHFRKLSMNPSTYLENSTRQRDVSLSTLYTTREQGESEEGGKRREVKGGGGGGGGERGWREEKRERERNSPVDCFDFIG